MNPYVKPETSEINYFYSAVTATGDFVMVTQLTTESCCDQESSQDCEEEELLNNPVLFSLQTGDGEICITFPKDGGCLACGSIEENGNFTISLDHCSSNNNCTLQDDGCCFRDGSTTLVGNFDGSQMQGTLTRIEQAGTLDPDDCGLDNGCTEIRNISADPA